MKYAMSGVNYGKKSFITSTSGLFRAKLKRLSQKFVPLSKKGNQKVKFYFNLDKTVSQRLAGGQLIFSFQFDEVKLRCLRKETVNCDKKPDLVTMLKNSLPKSMSR